MKILFLDLASNASSLLGTSSQTPNQGACIACVSEKKTESIRFIDHRIGDAGIMPVIDEVLKEAGWTDHDLTHVACVTGPGGFTSLRMAVTLANTYSDQLGIAMAGINLSDLYKSRAFVPPASPPNPLSFSHHTPTRRGGTAVLQNILPSKAPFLLAGDRGRIWMHSTKKTQLFVRSFGSTQWPEPTLISVEDLVSQLPEDISIIGEILPEHREAIAAKHPVYPEIAPIAEILPAFLADLPYTTEALTPWYGRGW